MKHKSGRLSVKFKVGVGWLLWSHFCVSAFLCPLQDETPPTLRWTDTAEICLATNLIATSEEEDGASQLLLRCSVLSSHTWMEWTLDFKFHGFKNWEDTHTQMWLCVVEAVILNWSPDMEKWDIFLKRSCSLWEQPVFLPRGGEFRKSCTRTATQRCCFSRAGAVRQRSTYKGVIKLKWFTSVLSQRKWH